MKIGDWVMHNDTGAIGRVRTMHRPGSYVSPINGQPVHSDVVELDDGNAFLLNPGYENAWSPLLERDVAFVAWVNDRVRDIVVEAVGKAKWMGVPSFETAAALRYVFERQARKLPTHRGGDPGIPVS